MFFNILLMVEFSGHLKVLFFISEGYDDNLLLNPGRFILSNKSDSANDLRYMAYFIRDS